MRSTKIITICSSSLCTCSHHMVILRTRNKITDFLMILAWASPFNVNRTIISLFISVTYIVQCPAKNGLQVTLNTKIHLRVLVTVWPDKHEMSCRRRLNAGPTSTTLTHHRTSPDQTPLPDGKSGSVLHNHPH